jgi:Flp pilus assembly protein TadD
MCQRRWIDAERELRTALRLSPGYARAHHWYAVLLRTTGSSEAASREFRRAIGLDPLSPEINAGSGYNYVQLSTDYETGIEQLRKALTLNPGHLYARWALAKAYYQQGLESKALEEFLKWDAPALLASAKTELRGVFEVSGFQGVLGKYLEMDAIRTGRPCTNDAILAPIMMALIGKRDLMFKCLQEVVDQGIPAVFELPVDPWFDEYRSDPRFQGIMQQLGLTS